MHYNGRRPSFRERVAAFMAGRRGSDELYRFLIIVWACLAVANIFVGSVIISSIGLAIGIYATYRAFSKNIYKRSRENDTYLKMTKGIRDSANLMKCKLRDRKTHVYKKCPKCKSVLRLPKERGKHTARCPRCSERFDVRI